MLDMDTEINTSTKKGTNKTKGQKVGYHEIPHPPQKQPGNDTKCSRIVIIFYSINDTSREVLVSKNVKETQILTSY